MRRFVVDSSVALKWFVPEKDSDLARNALDEAILLHAPDLLLIEFDNVLCRRLRAGEMPFSVALEVRFGLRRVPIEFTPTTELADQAFNLAHEIGDSMYDSLYLALAFLRDAQLLTADARLHRRITKAGLGDRVRLLTEGC